MIRRAFEAWKDSCGLRDELIYMPRRSNWWEFQRAYMHGTLGMEPLTKLVAKGLDIPVSFMWDNPLTTYRTTTGRRLGMGCFATTDDLQRPELSADTCDYFVAYGNTWRAGHDVAKAAQPSHLATSCIRFLNYLNGAGIRYESWEQHTEFTEQVYARITSAVDADIFALAGWHMLRLSQTEEMLTVGWCAPQAIRDWATRSPLTAVVGERQWSSRFNDIVTVDYFRLVRYNTPSTIVPMQSAMYPQDFRPASRSTTGSVVSDQNPDTGTGSVTPDLPPATSPGSFLQPGPLKDPVGPDVGGDHHQ